MAEKAEIDSGNRVGVPTEVADKLKALECEVREVRPAKKRILRQASANFAQAQLDRPFRASAMLDTRIQRQAAMADRAAPFLPDLGIGNGARWRRFARPR